MLTVELESYRKQIGLAGRLASLLGVILMLVLLDAIISGMEQAANIYTGYPGMTQTFSGSTSNPIKAIDRLSYEASEPGIRIRFIDAESSVWHHFWYGTLEIERSVRPGDYRLDVKFQPELADLITTSYTIRVLEDAASFQKQQKSLIRRHLGINPWLLFGGLLPLFVLSFWPIYRLSGKKERVMKALGRAVITKLQKADGRWFIQFSLGSDQGIQKNDSLALYTDDGVKIGNATAETVFPDKTVASADGALEIKATHEIRLLTSSSR